MSASVWKKSFFSQIGEVIAGGTPSTKISEYWNGDIPWVKISDIKGMYVTETEEFITEEGLMTSSAKVFELGTILFSIFTTIGKVAILSNIVLYAACLFLFDVPTVIYSLI